MPFPSPPWHLRAHLWLSLFAVRDSGRRDRPPAVYGAAFADYHEGGMLTYHELLVARPVRPGPLPRIRVTDIWVDSPGSMVGGRALWAIPKQLAELPMSERSVGPVERASWRLVTDGRQPAAATFTSVPAAALVRTPYAVRLAQQRDDGTTALTPMVGSARALPCHATWTFDPAGPLGFLHGRRPVASFRLADARLRVG